MCKISVITSVYNGEKYIGETIESIVNQSFKDWEYIILDNCSEDKTVDVVQAYALKDRRIRLVKNEKNLGFANSLNKGSAMAVGTYIAHVDHDDISYPNRLEMQYEYMEQHPDIYLSGGCHDLLVNGKYKKNLHTIRIDTTGVMRFASVFSPFGIMSHSTFFSRRKELADCNIKYRDLRYVEDLALIYDVLRVGKVGYLPERLIAYRIHDSQVTNKLTPELQYTEQRDIFLEFLSVLPIENKEIIKKAFYGKFESINDVAEYVSVMESYAKRCGLGNSMQDFAANKVFRQMYRAMFDRQIIGMDFFLEYLKSPYREKMWFVKRRGLSLLKQCLFKEDKMKYRF